MPTIQLTADGTPTLFVPELDEHYHSVNGAAQESRHIFLEAGLKHVARPRVRILEIGFGTGLTALLTLQETEKRTGLSVEYYSIERYPLDADITSRLNYGTLLWPDEPQWFPRLHEAAWNQPVQLTPSFTLYKIEGDATSCPLPDAIDLIYFDAFAPDKQPELWTPKVFQRIARHTTDGGTFVTYCAKGEVRRRLQAAGFRMERLPGPPGKRHILRGTKEKSAE